MRAGSGFLLIAVGLLLLYTGVTGKFGCFSTFGNCMLGRAPIPTGAGQQTGGAGSSVDLGQITALFPDLTIGSGGGIFTPPFSGGGSGINIPGFAPGPVAP